MDTFKIAHLVFFLKSLKTGLKFLWSSVSYWCFERVSTEIEHRFTLSCTNHTVRVNYLNVSNACCPYITLTIIISDTFPHAQGYFMGQLYGKLITNWYLHEQIDQIEQINDLLASPQIKVLTVTLVFVIQAKIIRTKL